MTTERTTKITGVPTPNLLVATTAPTAGLWTRLFVVQLLGFAVLLPDFFVSALLPTILRDRGVPLDQLAWLALSTAPSWLRWLAGPLVDGRWTRTRWIVMFSALAAAGYIIISEVDLVGNFAILIGILTLINALLVLQQVAGEAYHIESFTEAERPYGAVVSIVAPMLVNIVVFVGLTALYEAMGWRATAYAAAAVIIGCALPVLLIRERVSVEHRAALREGRRPDLRLFFRRPDWLLITVLVTLFGISQAGIQSISGPFFVDAGFSVGDVGILMGSCLTLAVIFGAIVSGVIGPSVGLRGMLVLSLGTQAVGCIALWILLSVSKPSLLIAGTAFFCYVLGLMPAVYALNWSRMNWPSAQQSGTDNAVIGTIGAIAATIGGAIASISAEHLGYKAAFAILMVLAFAVPTLYLTWFRRVGKSSMAE
jgi:MFS transporter, putative signal transducer